MIKENIANKELIHSIFSKNKLFLHKDFKVNGKKDFVINKLMENIQDQNGYILSDFLNQKIIQDYILERNDFLNNKLDENLLKKIVGVFYKKHALSFMRLNKTTIKNLNNLYLLEKDLVDKIIKKYNLPLWVLNIDYCKESEDDFLKELEKLKIKVKKGEHLSYKFLKYYENVCEINLKREIHSEEIVKLSLDLGRKILSKRRECELENLINEKSESKPKIKI